MDSREPDDDDDDDDDEDEDDDDDVLIKNVVIWSHLVNSAL